MTLPTKKVPLLTLFILYNLFVYAQIPDNFEFLDHRVRLSYPGVATSLEDKLYYVSHNAVRPFTTVNVVDYEGKVETILSLDWLSSESKIFTTSDTSSVIILDELIEYDIFYPGFYMIHINQNKVEIDSLFTDYEQYNFEVYGSVVDSLGRVVFKKDGKVVRLENDSIVDIAYTDKYVSLYHNANYQLYGYDSKWIYSLEGNNEIAIDSIDNYIAEIKSFNDENLILSREYLTENVVHRLEVYNIDFSEKIKTFVIPSPSIFRYSFDYIRYNGEEVILALSNNDRLEIISIDTLGVSTMIHEGEAKDEQIYSLIPLEEDRYLIGGTYGRNRFSRNLFFRNYSLTEETIYDRVNVGLHDFELNRVYSDTISIETYPGSKTFHFGRHNFEMELSIENQGPESISLVNVYSIDKLDDFSTKFHFDFEYDGEISPFEIKSKTYEDSRYIDADVLRDSVDIPFFIPGADFKFNENPLWDFEVVVDIEELIEDAEFNLYPNPTNDFLNLSFDQPVADLLIYDLNGVLQYSKFSTNSSNKIDVANLPAGTYFLRANLKSQKGYIISKFIKI